MRWSLVDVSVSVIHLSETWTFKVYSHRELIRIHLQQKQMRQQLQAVPASMFMLNAVHSYPKFQFPFLQVFRLSH